jgi:hypothetical protein
MSILNQASDTRGAAVSNGGGISAATATQHELAYLRRILLIAGVTDRAQIHPNAEISLSDIAWRRLILLASIISSYAQFFAGDVRICRN